MKLTHTEQDELIEWLKAVSPADLRVAMRDRERRYEIDSVFQAWRMRTQIRQMRLARGWTQEELGRQIGMRQSAIARLENMYAPVDVRVVTLRRIARAFDVRLKIGFCGWLSLIVDVINMGCRLRPKSFTEEYEPK